MLSRSIILTSMKKIKFNQTFMGISKNSEHSNNSQKFDYQLYKLKYKWFIPWNQKKDVNKHATNISSF
jgi:hypothetical protein